MHFPRLSPGDRLSADLVNRMLDALEMLTGMTADPASGLELIRSAGNMCLRAVPGEDSADALAIARVLGADTTLAAAIDDSQTALAVASFIGFPSSGSYYILVDSEIMQVTGGAGMIGWTVSRAQLGTSAAAHTLGAVVYQTTALQTSCTDTDTTITVLDGSLFPQNAAQTPYYILVDSEIMQVTGGAGTTTLTVGRGQFSTTAAAHSANAPTLLWVPTSGTLHGARQAVLTSLEPVSGIWTDAEVIFLGPINGFGDPHYVPLLVKERYFALPDGDDGIRFYQAQATPLVPPATTAVVRVTSATIDSTSMMYPAKVEIYADGRPPTASDGDNCWALPPNGETLTTQRYPAIFVEIHSDGEAVYVPCGTPGGGAAIVRVTSDTPDTTSMMYPAFVEDPADGTPVTLTDGAACWAFGPNAGALTAGFYDAVFMLTHAADNKPVYFVAGTVIGGGQCDGSGNTILVTA